jgi:uncharacterized membrane protein
MISRSNTLLNVFVSVNEEKERRKSMELEEKLKDRLVKDKEYYRQYTRLKKL